MDINQETIQFSYPAKNYIIQGFLGVILIPLTITPITAFFLMMLAGIIISIIDPNFPILGACIAASIFIVLVLLTAWFFFARAAFKSFYADKQNYMTSAIVFTTCGALTLIVLILLFAFPLNRGGGGIPF